MMTGMSRGQRLLFIAPMALVGMVAFVALGGLLVRTLWNWLLPPMFGWPTLGFWQALGMLGLCRILVGGFGFRGSPGPYTRRRIIERWEAMSPEERERFRQGMSGRWGFRGPGGGGEGTGETI